VIAQTISNVNGAIGISNFTRAVGQSTIQTVAANFLGNAYAAQAQIDVGEFVSAFLQLMPFIVNIQIAANMLNLFVGTATDNHTGIHVDNHTGLHMDNHAGVHLDMHMGQHVVTEDPPQVTLKTGGSVEMSNGMTAELKDNVVTITNAAHTTLASTHIKA
jgi:hypothetical protein